MANQSPPPNAKVKKLHLGHVNSNIYTVRVTVDPGNTNLDINPFLSSFNLQWSSLWAYRCLV